MINFAEITKRHFFSCNADLFLAESSLPQIIHTGPEIMYLFTTSDKCNKTETKYFCHFLVFYN